MPLWDRRGYEGFPLQGVDSVRSRIRAELLMQKYYKKVSKMAV